VSPAPEHGEPVLAAETDESPVLPIPSPEVRHLGRWEGILGWAMGWIVGMVIAIAAIIALVVR
jgi:hypothetical protein